MTKDQGLPESLQANVLVLAFCKPGVPRTLENSWQLQLSRDASSLTRL